MWRAGLFPFHCPRAENTLILSRTLSVYPSVPVLVNEQGHDTHRCKEILL